MKIGDIEVGVHYGYHRGSAGRPSRRMAHVVALAVETKSAPALYQAQRRERVIRVRFEEPYEESWRGRYATGDEVQVPARDLGPWAEVERLHAGHVEVDAATAALLDAVRDRGWDNLKVYAVGTFAVEVRLGIADAHQLAALLVDVPRNPS